MKIGIAGINQGNNDRIAQHRRLGWSLHSEHLVQTGDDAHAIEQAILGELRGQGHGPFLTINELPNGWSETFDAAVVSADRLTAMIAERITEPANASNQLTLF